MNWGKTIFIDKPVICDPSIQKLVKDFIPLYRPVRSLISQSRGSCLTAFSNLKLWGVGAQKTEVSVGLVTELRVVGAGSVPGHLGEMQTDGTTACTNLP